MSNGFNFLPQMGGQMQPWTMQLRDQLNNNMATGNTGFNFQNTPLFEGLNFDAPGGFTKGPKTPPGVFDGMTGLEWGQLGLGALMGGVSAYTGLQNLSLAQDQFAFSKDFSQANLGNQARLVNADLEARQRGRIASGKSTMSVEDYMAKYGAQEKI